MNKLIISIVVIFVLAGATYYVMTNHKDTAPVVTGPIKVIAFGDSLTAGFGVTKDENYPNQLKAALPQYDIQMVNLGVSGDTTADAKTRVQEVIDEKPDIVLLGFGGNDALRVVPVDEVRANLESVIETLKNSDTHPRIVLLQMQAFLNGGLGYKRDFDSLYEQLAQKYKLTLVPFIITKIYLDQKYVLPDRIHMNKEGYAYVVNNYLKEAVQDEIKQLKR